MYDWFLKRNILIKLLETVSTKVYKLNLQFQVFRKTELKNFDFDQFETKQIFYSSKDGTKVPMFIVKKKVKAKTTIRFYQH